MEFFFVMFAVFVVMLVALTAAIVHRFKMRLVHGHRGGSSGG